MYLQKCNFFIIYELSSQCHHNFINCNLYWQLITSTPATIYPSQAAQACNHHGAEQTVAVLHWPRHQWVASPAGMCRPAARRTHWTLILNESVQFCVWHCLFVCWDITNTFQYAVFWTTLYYRSVFVLALCSLQSVFMYMYLSSCTQSYIRL